MKRDLAQAIFEMQVAIDNVAAVGVLFGDEHPEYAELLTVVAAGIDQMQQLLFKFAEKAWGYDHDRLMTWRK
jgi:hypothetical protein